MAYLPTSRPSRLPKYAQVCLEALVERGLADFISLGGAFGLLHYLDYRATRDLDAWWSSDSVRGDRERVVETLKETLQRYGTVRTRAWGDVVSIELEDETGEVFSFQIAGRSAMIGAPSSAGWIDVPLDSFADLLSSKMVALVERGAPRDFRDIFAICHAGLTTPSDCWRLWALRQRAAGSDDDPSRARLAVETHLARIAAHRPLDRIQDDQGRAEAERLRDWFSNDFLGAIA